MALAAQAVQLLPEALVSRRETYQQALQLAALRPAMQAAAAVVAIVCMAQEGTEARLLMLELRQQAALAMAMAQAAAALAAHKAAAALQLAAVQAAQALAATSLLRSLYKHETLGFN